MMGCRSDTEVKAGEPPIALLGGQKGPPGLGRKPVQLQAKQQQEQRQPELRDTDPVARLRCQHSQRWYNV